MALPIISTDSPGCNEVVTNDVNGILIPAQDTNALINGLTQLVSDPQSRQRFGTNSRKLAIEKFELSVIARQTRLLYEQTLANSSNPELIKHVISGDLGSRLHV